jgi:hypothetical protein
LVRRGAELLELSLKADSASGSSKKEPARSLRRFLFLFFAVLSNASVKRAEQIQDQHNEQDCANDPESSACAPPGVPVVATTSSKQQDEDNDYQ